MRDDWMDDGHMPVLGGSHVKPRRLKQPWVRHVPKDDLGRHLLTLFTIHHIRLNGMRVNLNAVGLRLCRMTMKEKADLLVQMNQFLAITCPRQREDSQP
jgi:hypothetical protein